MENLIEPATKRMKLEDLNLTCDSGSGHPNLISEMPSTTAEPRNNAVIASVITDLNSVNALSSSVSAESATQGTSVSLGGANESVVITISETGDLDNLDSKHLLDSKEMQKSVPDTNGEYTNGLASYAESGPETNGDSKIDMQPQTLESLNLRTSDSKLSVSAGLVNSRLVVKHGTSEHFTILVNDLKADPTCSVSEISLDDLSTTTLSYDNIHLCVSFDEGAEDMMAKLVAFLLSDSQLFHTSKNIHIHFDFGSAKNWSQWLESFQLSYAQLRNSISKEHCLKVTQCSLIKKYHREEGLSDSGSDPSRITKDIQQEVSTWKNLSFLDLPCNSLQLVSGVQFPEFLESLNIAGGHSLTSLQGVQLPSRLKLLDVSLNIISDIDYIVFPRSLKTLTLMGNNIYFLENADFPPGLENLDISCNRVESLRNVNFPRDLKSLSISSNPIECIKGARIPEGIEYLDVSGIPNESMTGIKFPDLTRFLNLQSSMTNTRGLKLPLNVEELNLGCNGVNSINPLKLPNSIRSLYLCENNIKTLNKVAFPTSIRELFLGNNMITTLKNVQFPATLEILDMEMDPDTDEHEKYLTSLKDVYFPASLRVLKLGYHLIKTVEGIEFPYGLEELSLAYNDLRVFKNVKFGPKLHTLDLSGNQELFSLENVMFPESLRELKVPSLVVDNLPAVIVERANRHEVLITKSMPYTT